MVMPEMTGVEVLQALQAQNQRIPVVVHTSDIQDVTREECLALGAKAFLNKPLKDEELLAVVNQIVNATQEG
jgi:twitching motility two-component system response regulator PilH